MVLRRWMLLLSTTTILTLAKNRNTASALLSRQAASHLSFSRRHQRRISIHCHQHFHHYMTPPPITLNEGDALFGKFVIRSDCIFYNSSHSLAFCNLRPIVPGHVLVISKRVAPHLRDLSEAEYTDLWNSVRTVQQILQQCYADTTAFNVAVQDGRSAGQSVRHVHVHILPRRAGDFERNDDVYQEMEEWAPRKGDDANKKTVAQLDVPEDADRRDRTPQEMAEEALTYKRIGETMALSKG